MFVKASEAGNSSEENFSLFLKFWSFCFQKLGSPAFFIYL
ncbi:hypothetical protein C723_2460 [Christiangramia flava JLT2011]|uniref:Uncharacterized protein n=1 Tax=Christiangramia flava JLT2011 TaxID=1229726 RepID=A0A1L7I0E6_9FLAO|nr:hypothetical protein GRFL_0345 [Christiangramia flava JLT2011]OSS38742.1 hypothetical protein C723_2460 [Christiangramia flava JLT2011]